MSAIARLNVRTPKYAAAMPKAVPTAARTNASVRNCLTTAPRDAPSAVRMPTSFVRCAARSSSRLATFAQAMSSTKNTAPSIVQQELARLGSDLSVHEVHDRRADPIALLLVLRRDTSRDCVRVCACGIDRHALLELCDDLNVLTVAALERERIELQGEPESAVIREAIVHPALRRRW